MLLFIIFLKVNDFFAWHLLHTKFITNLQFYRSELRNAYNCLVFKLS